MQILINDKEIDFELDKQLSLDELLENIQTWASKENMFILDYLVNGNPVEIPSEVWNSENIEKLEIMVGNKHSLLWENILETGNYIQKLIDYLIPRIQDSETSGPIENSLIEEGLIWVSNSYQSLGSHFKDEESQKFNNLFIEDCLKNEQYILIINFLYIALAKLNLWKKQIFYLILDSVDSGEVRGIYETELSQIISDLEKVASHLTVGKNLDALTKLEDIMEWLSIGIVVFQKTGTSDEKISNIRSILDELNDSLKKQDFVTLADIIDFDLKDALEDFIN